MHVTIIKDDNAVIVDGERYLVDCGDLPVAFHALQWDGTRGEIEYRVTRCEHCGARSKKGNEIILDFSPYQKYKTAWRFAKSAAAVEKAEKAEIDAAGPET